MLQITEKDMAFRKLDLDYSINSVDHVDKMIPFFALLAEKINLNANPAKVFFFHLLKHYAVNDDVDFSFKTKERFLRNFIFKKQYGRVMQKSYQYVNPVWLSMYVPEFYETINATFEGDDVATPVLKRKGRALYEKHSDESKQKTEEFWNTLTPALAHLDPSLSENAATLFLVELLKDGGVELPIQNEAHWFYKAFRQTDVIDNDIFTLDFTCEGYIDFDRGETKVCKDWIVWKLLNERPQHCAKADRKNLEPNQAFFDAVALFFKEEGEQEATA